MAPSLSASPLPSVPAAPIAITAGEACHLLGVSAAQLSELRAAGLFAPLPDRSRPRYARSAIESTRRLLNVTARQRWRPETLAWYADLAFAAEIGRVVLLPLPDASVAIEGKPASWLETPHAAPVLRDLEERRSAVDERVAAVIRALLGAVTGSGRFWADAAAVRSSPAAPVIEYLRVQGLLGPTAPAADSGEPFALLVLAFATLAPPISQELRQIVQGTCARLQPGAAGKDPEERSLILREQLVAVDRLYAARATEIHSPFDQYEMSAGVLVVPRRSIALQLQLPLESPAEALDNILDVLRPFLGVYGARVVQALYEIANDPPFWRSPLITIDTNQLLDRLGEKRDSRGIHYSRNRARLRDTLNAAHNLEIVGEYSCREDGKPVRKAFRRPVLSLIGATFDSDESAGITTEELFQKGLPRTMQVRLNFYEGVRRTDGSLGNQYVLMPRLANPESLPKANYAGTHERLRHYLLCQRRQTAARGPLLEISRGAALENAGITNKNITRATQTLEKALRRLVEEGVLLSYSAIPLRPHETFTCALRETVTAD